MEIDKVVKSHEGWCERFLEAVNSKTIGYIEAIESDDCCELGQWLREGGLARFGTTPEYAGCLELHAAFHLAAGHAAQEALAGNFPEAARLLAPGSAYAVASASLLRALGRLQQVAAASGNP